MSDLRSIRCDLMVIGSGMAGMAAALFAARGGIDTVQVGVTGEINFASGLLDLLGVHPVEKGIRWADPWDGIEKLVADEPEHPYGLLSIAEIRRAMEQCLAFLNEAGLPYQTHGRRNSRVITPAGTAKTTYAVPGSMAPGVQALEDRRPTLLVDFEGLKGYSTRQIIETLGRQWPDLKGTRIAFPDSMGEIYSEHAARSLDMESTRRKLAAAIRPHLGSAQAVGLPAILGIYRTTEALTDLKAALGVPVFEIPTMLPAVTGLRLREAFERHLPQIGVRAFYQQKVLEAVVLPSGGFKFLVGHSSPEIEILAERAVLATGRFFGKGLRADRSGIRETIFGLPVDQPRERRFWHHKDFLHATGHPINRAGLRVDYRFRPVDESGRVIHDRLFAAGSILAHQDWMRQKCGSGLAIATAFGALLGATERSRSGVAGGSQ